MNLIIEFPSEESCRVPYLKETLRALLDNGNIHGIYLQSSCNLADLTHFAGEKYDGKIKRIKIYNSDTFLLDDNTAFIFFSDPSSFLNVKRSGSSKLIGYFKPNTKFDSWIQSSPDIIITDVFIPLLLKNIEFSKFEELKDKLLYLPHPVSDIDSVVKDGEKNSENIIFYASECYDEKLVSFQLESIIKALVNSQKFKVIDASKASCQEISSIVAAAQKVTTILIPGHIQSVIAHYCALTNTEFATWVLTSDEIFELHASGFDFKAIYPETETSLRKQITNLLNSKEPDTINFAIPKCKELRSPEMMASNLLANSSSKDDSLELFSILSMGTSWNTDGTLKQEKLYPIFLLLKNLDINKDYTYVAKLVKHIFIQNQESPLDTSAAQEDIQWYFSIIERIKSLYANSFSITEQIISEYARFSQFKLFESYIQNYLGRPKQIKHPGLIFTNSFFKETGDSNAFFNFTFSNSKKDQISKLCSYLKFDLENNYYGPEETNIIMQFCMLNIVIDEAFDINKIIIENTKLSPYLKITISIFLKLAKKDSQAIEVLKSVSLENLRRDFPTSWGGQVPHTNFVYLCASLLLRIEDKSLVKCIEIVKHNTQYFAENSWFESLHYSILTAITCKKLGLVDEAAMFFNIAKSEDITQKFAADWFSRIETETQPETAVQFIKVLPLICPSGKS